MTPTARLPPATSSVARGPGFRPAKASRDIIGASCLTEEELDLRRHGWEGDTPLWLYILRESAAREDGERLGEVGGAIVGEVLIEIILRDPESYLALDPSWEPTLPRHEGSFRLRDLLVPA